MQTSYFPDDVILLDHAYLEIKDTIHTRGIGFWKGSRKIYFMMVGDYERYNETVDERPRKRGRQFSHDDEDDVASDDESESEMVSKLKPESSKIL